MPQFLKHWESHYSPPDPDLWKGRIDSPAAERYYQKIDFADLSKNLPSKKEKNAFAFLGFKSDEGVKRNQGRGGAYLGPVALRKALAALPFFAKEPCQLFDAGDIFCDDGNLESAQKSLASVVAALQNLRILPVLFGGGHEIAWGHYQGIAEANPGAAIAIINFDAHYDLRPLSKEGQGNSGTSFLQIAEEMKRSGKDFHYYCVGIQKTANSSALMKTAKQLGVKTVFAEEIVFGNPQLLEKEFSNFYHKHDRVYVSICLDVFAAPFAPGVSAPQILGLNPWHVIPLLRKVSQCGKIVGIDFAELAPNLDIDNHTARLAAALVAEFISNFNN